jgi:hypothetical protein
MSLLPAGVGMMSGGNVQGGCPPVAIVGGGDGIEDKSIMKASILASSNMVVNGRVCIESAIKLAGKLQLGCMESRVNRTLAGR